MERVKKVSATPVSETIKLPRWKKEGGGHLRLTLAGKKVIIKPGQVFYAKESDLPKAFMDTLVCLDEFTLNESKQKEILINEEIKQVYSLKEAEEGKFDVVNPIGKPINEKPMDEESAKALKNVLEN